MTAEMIRISSRVESRTEKKRGTKKIETRNSEGICARESPLSSFCRAERHQRKYSETEIRPEDSGDVSAAAWKPNGRTFRRQQRYLNNDRAEHGRRHSLPRKINKNSFGWHRDHGCPALAKTEKLITPKVAKALCTIKPGIFANQTRISIN